MTPTASFRPPSLWLATGSPRRRDLLEQAGYAIAGRLRPSAPVDEAIAAGEAAERAARRLARAKLEAALAGPGRPAGAVLLAADTLVAGPDGRVLGKPEDAVDAERMLTALSGRWHEVVTAVAVGDGRRRREALVRSRLKMARLDPATIRAYVATGEPLDKAGAYGIQGRAGAFVEAVEGDCSAVIGLPLAVTRERLAAFGIRPAWQDRDETGAP
jgi:septum formation protein